METITDNANCLICLQDSDYGVIGFRNKIIFHEHYCHGCYLKKKRNIDEQDIVNRGSSPQNN